jgi:hypothetical protein
METKKCGSCGITKCSNNFHKNKSKKDGLQEFCKVCRKLNAEQNKEARSEYRKKWYLENSDKVKKMEKTRYYENKENINQKRRELYSCDEEYRRKVTEHNKKYYASNKKYFYLMSKKWAEANKDKRNEISKAHYSKYKTLMVCRRLVKRTLKYLGTPKEEKTIEILGYSPTELRLHLEKKFEVGMNWENYGQWHVDHIRPISSFSLDESPKVINALDNLQPLWSFENLSKGSNYEV